MDTDYAIAKAGSGAALGRLLGVSRAAVSLWRKSGTLPPLQVYRLREVRPRWVAEWRRAQ
jgi:hypothetical protein